MWCSAILTHQRNTQCTFGQLISLVISLSVAILMFRCLLALSCPPPLLALVVIVHSNTFSSFGLLACSLGNGVRQLSALLFLSYFFQT